MSKPLLKCVLVTGCAGDIGLSIGRLLRHAEVCEKVIGIDVHDHHPGEKFFDACEVVPRADDPAYEARLARVVQEHQPDLIVPMTEAEIGRFSARKQSSVLKIPLLMADQKSVEVGLDKWLTAEFLREENLPFPWTVLADTCHPNALPCIWKARSGRGSKNVRIVPDQRTADFLSGSDRKGFIWQELLLPDSEEFTCGVFRSKAGDVRAVSFRRELSGGLTGKGEVAELPEISQLLEELAEKLSLVGSINVQLRLTPKGPRIFEINPRFSSTVLFRHLLGFEDVVWSIRDLLGLKIPPYVPPKAGTRFYRISQEIIQSRS